MRNQDSIAIYESKDSEKVVNTIDLTIENLSHYCSEKYAKRIISAHNSSMIWGVYWTPSGRIKATFL